MKNGGGGGISMKGNLPTYLVSCMKVLEFFKLFLGSILTKDSVEFDFLDFFSSSSTCSSNCSIFYYFSSISLFYYS